MLGLRKFQSWWYREEIEQARKRREERLAQEQLEYNRIWADITAYYATSSHGKDWLLVAFESPEDVWPDLGPGFRYGAEWLPARSNDRFTAPVKVAADTVDGLRSMQRLMAEIDMFGVEYFERFAAKHGVDF